VGFVVVGTIGQQWLTYQVDSVSPHPEKLKKKERKLLGLFLDPEDGGDMFLRNVC
jgi:hypothetical protein